MIKCWYKRCCSYIFWISEAKLSNTWSRAITRLSDVSQPYMSQQLTERWRNSVVFKNSGDSQTSFLFIVFFYYYFGYSDTIVPIFRHFRARWTGLGTYMADNNSMLFQHVSSLSIPIQIKNTEHSCLVSIIAHCQCAWFLWILGEKHTITSTVGAHI